MCLIDSLNEIALPKYRRSTDITYTIKYEQNSKSLNKKRCSYFVAGASSEMVHLTIIICYKYMNIKLEFSFLIPI